MYDASSDGSRFVIAAGYGYRVYGAGNVLKCSNTATNAGQGLSNVACTP